MSFLKKLHAKFLVITLLGLLSAAGIARADAAAGTPLFTCTAPTQGFDALAGAITLFTLPATGADSLARFAFYIDPPALVGRPPNDPRVIYIPSATTAQKLVSGVGGLPPVCSWQTVAGDVAAGNHTLRITALDATGREGPATNAVAFTVPAAVRMGPVAPTAPAVN